MAACRSGPPPAISAGTGTATGGAATLLPDDEILVGYHVDKKTQLVTRSRDYGLTWDEPVEGPFGYYIWLRDELWSVWGKHNPDVIGVDRGTYFDELNKDIFWNVEAISKDRGKAWSDKRRLEILFPEGIAYAPIKGETDAVVGLRNQPAAWVMARSPN